MSGEIHLQLGGVFCLKYFFGKHLPILGEMFHFDKIFFGMGGDVPTYILVPTLETCLVQACCICTSGEGAEKGTEALF